MSIAKDFGERIKTMRLSRGMTQQQLADAIEQSRTSVGMYEIGEREPDFETLEALADVFNVPMVAFFGNDRITPEDFDILETLHQNPKLNMLFDHSRKLKDSDIEFMLQYAKNILKEREKH